MCGFLGYTVHYILSVSYLSFHLSFGMFKIPKFYVDICNMSIPRNKLTIAEADSTLLVIRLMLDNMSIIIIDNISFC